ncbi:catalase family protein [Mycobacterium sp. NPDC050853]|uniref:catalase family protein n=1 Tax=Mycobacteriaceae TaxID=1762 RepID=UPI0015DFE0DA|nr:catalase family protein [Mycobacteroides sp. LB1]
MSTADESLDTPRTYLRYSDDMGAVPPGEEEVIDKIIKVLHKNNERAFRKYRHAVRDAHAKSHGILRGELTVYPDLPPHLRQGIFATPGRYPVISRLSTTSGLLRSDRIRGVRGLGIKVLGVSGPRTLPDDDATTQDFVLVTHREFLFAGAKAYLRRGMPTAWLLARLPDTALRLGSNLLGGVAKFLPRVGLSLPESVAVFVRPNTHILGDTFYSSAPLRYGEYVAKLSYVPLSKSVRDLEGVLLPEPVADDELRNLVAEFFQHNSAEYEVRAQLCTDAKIMPLEDATVAWPEADSPHRGIAKIVFPVQDSYGAERRAFGDDVLSFNSWRALAAHRPLGSINRLKLRVYEASSNFRHEKNGVSRMEPAGVQDLPD